MNSSLLKQDTLENADAPVPYPQPRYTPVSRLRQYGILLLTLLSNYRSEWFFHIFAGLLLPVSLVFFAHSVAGTVDMDSKIFLMGGNMALSIAFGPSLFLIGRLGWARQNKEFDYWITLPIPKMVLVIAIISLGLLFALPGLLGTYLLGSLLLGLPFSGGWTLIFLVPLSALSMAGFGALIGSMSPNGQVANVIGNLFIMLIGFLSPMMIRPENLPVPLQLFSRVVPTTYIADAFRIAMGGHAATSLTQDVVVLLITTVLLLGFAQWKLDWRTH